MATRGTEMYEVEVTKTQLGNEKYSHRDPSIAGASSQARQAAGEIASNQGKVLTSTNLNARRDRQARSKHPCTVPAHRHVNKLPKA